MGRFQRKKEYGGGVRSWSAESVKKLFILPKYSISTRLRVSDFMGGFKVENAESVKKLFISPRDWILS